MGILSFRPEKKDLDKFDRIFVMEQWHKDRLLQLFPNVNNKEVIVLDIPDIYVEYQQELIEVLKSKLANHYSGEIEVDELALKRNRKKCW